MIEDALQQLALGNAVAKDRVGAGTPGFWTRAKAALDQFSGAPGKPSVLGRIGMATRRIGQAQPTMSGPYQRFSDPYYEQMGETQLGTDIIDAMTRRVRKPMQSMEY